MKRLALTLVVLVLAASDAPAETVHHSWGAAGKKFSYPGTLKVVSTGGVNRLVFDLSALPKGTKVHHASLFCTGGQPLEPIRICPVDKPGSTGFQPVPGEGTGSKPVPPEAVPLKLEGPWYRSFDATEVVRAWTADPSKNLGLALASFAGTAAASYLEILYEGSTGVSPVTTKGTGPMPVLPQQVEGLRVFHNAGQTFLVWKELPVYRPPAEEILYVQHMAGGKTSAGPRPDKADKDSSPAAAVTLKTLRDLQGLAVRDKPVGEWAREMAPFVRLKAVPEAAYRVYRHSQAITPANIAQAEFVGQVGALCAYQDGFILIDSHGEYYAPRERGDSIIPTFSVGEGKPVLPGEAYYVYSAQADGKSFYAVTAVQDGTENVSEFSPANSTAEPVVEKKEPPQPVLQFVTVNRTRYGQTNAAEYWYGYWLAPPYANLPENTPRRVVFAIPDTYKEPGPMVLTTHAGLGPSWMVDKTDSVYLHIEQDIAYGGDLCYNQGRGTLRSFRESKVDYFSERYTLNVVNWTLNKWKIDRARITSSVGTHFGVRHPELFPILWFGPYEVDYDMKWNPGFPALASRLGPADIATTVDGHKAWDVFDLSWYLSQDPGKDIPFFVSNVEGKESGHAVEYGWQDDAKGLCALRKARQPHVANWGGGAISREVVEGLSKMSWTTSVPAFSNCSLDGSLGNGDPADGDPLGQINGFLFWEVASSVDEKDRWEMTVYLAKDCFADACTVDLTPRHCRLFLAEKPQAGQKFKWTNVSVSDNRELRNGQVTADKWGLVTLEKITVTKGRNRLTIQRVQ